MAKLTYTAICSLDGYTVDATGNFDWAAPSEEVHAFVNDQERAVGTYLYGRRLYDTMAVWETWDSPEPVARDYAEIWRGADKIVYSRTLTEVASARTRIEPEFSPSVVRALKDSAVRDLSIGGAELAGQALAAGLVDQVRLLLVPVIVGNGTRALPDGVPARLELVDERRFGNGTVYVAYRLTDRDLVDR